MSKNGILYYMSESPLPRSLAIDPCNFTQAYRPWILIGPNGVIILVEAKLMDTIDIFLLEVS